MSGLRRQIKRYLRLLYLLLIKVWNTILWIFLHKRSLVVNAFLIQKGFTVCHNNWGDDLNYYLIKALTGKHIFNYSSFFHPNIINYICIGSIVEDMSNKKSIVWGGGVMNDDYVDFIKPNKVMATRGPLTRDYLMRHGVQSPPIYGDPALLTPIVYKPVVEKNIEIGIIPHVSELNNPIIHDFISKTPGAVLIDLLHYNKWTDIIDLICRCKIIASSSLHGLILSDAYNVPNVWICLNQTTGGGEFKFKDYFGGVNRAFERYEVKDYIDAAVILYYCSQYKGITFRERELLDACPFLINK